MSDECYKIPEPMDLKDIFNNMESYEAKMNTYTPQKVANMLALLNADYHGVFNYTVDTLEAGNIPVVTTPYFLECMDECLVAMMITFVMWCKERKAAGIKDDLSGTEYPPPATINTHVIDPNKDIDVDAAQIQAYGAIKKEDVN